MTKCPLKFPNDRVLQAAFEEMYRTETALDDMDYATNSPKLQSAMRAAKRFNMLLGASE